MDRSNPYEAAFEGYLQWHRHCYIAVDESRRSFLGDRRVKSLDFVVYGESGSGWLVDVKGRRYPGGSEQRPRRVWECWSTREDVDSLQQWAERLGPGYRAVLVFLYKIMPYAPPVPEGEEWWTWQGRRYLLRAVTVDDYQMWMRTRSPRWQTVSLPTAAFWRVSRPFHELLREPLAPEIESPF
jgi:hypothetical protein